MTNLDLVNFVKTAKDKPVMYMWGDYGRAITEATITAKAKQYPTHYSLAYQAELREAIKRGGIGCDCTGLIKWFLWTGGDIDKVPKYDGATDNSASGWYNAAKVRGAIKTLPETPGLILSFPGHCGVYVGGGNVIECTKGAYGNGVVQTKLTDRKWEKWCECIYIDYITESPAEVTQTPLTGKPAHVVKDCPTYSKLNKKQLPIGEVYAGETVMYLGDYGGLAAIIYPTSASEKIAFVDKSNLTF